VDGAPAAEPHGERARPLSTVNRRIGARALPASLA
jgi:hypothetical protein